jgi:hypothetical protein
LRIQYIMLSYMGGQTALIKDLHMTSEQSVLFIGHTRG